jgi:hypothetical protein
VKRVGKLLNKTLVAGFQIGVCQNFNSISLPLVKWLHLAIPLISINKPKRNIGLKLRCRVFSMSFSYSIPPAT